MENNPPIPFQHTAKALLTFLHFHYLNHRIIIYTNRIGKETLKYLLYSTDFLSYIFLPLTLALGLSIAACAAANRAMGTLKGEQLT